MWKKGKIIGNIIVLTFLLLVLGLATPDTRASEENLLYSSYFGGSDDDYGLCIAHDSEQNIILAGLTYSADFPTTEGAYDRSHNGESDVFICKWSSDGTQLLFSTLFGGSKSENFIGSTGIPYTTLELAVDSNDDIIVYGTTSSDDLPVTPSAINGTYQGNQDLFLCKLATNGSKLLFSTYLGGMENDFYNLGNNRLILDNEDNIYITGNTESQDFPTTPNAFKTTIQNREAFVCKITPDGSSLIYSTLFGGSDKEYSMSLALDSEKNMIFGGTTLSNDYPTTTSAFDKTYNNADLFISKIAADGSSLMFSTYIGDSEWEQLNGIIVDKNDDIYLTGLTDSANFPTIPGCEDDTFNGHSDIFITKLESSGSQLLASTFLGGLKGDYPSGLALSIEEGDPCIIGYTASNNFPTKKAYDTGLNGVTDYFFSRLAPDLTTIKYSTYLGGSATDDHGNPNEAWGHDAGEMITLINNSVILVGSTRSTDFPVTSNAYNNTSNGDSDVFMTLLSYSITTTTPPGSSPGFEAIFIISGLLAILIFFKKRR